MSRILSPVTSLCELGERKQHIKRQSSHRSRGVDVRIKENFVNQILHSCEKRLARILLLLARSGRQSGSKSVVLKVNQQTLAEIVGTTRSRVSFFMNGFSKRGFIHYKGSVRVHRRPFTFALREYVKCEFPHEFTQDLVRRRTRWISTR